MVFLAVTVVEDVVVVVVVVIEGEEAVDLCWFSIRPFMFF